MSERGEINLVGLLVASTLALLLMTSTLAILNGTQTEGEVLAGHADAEQRVRSATDLLADLLRNLASPTPDQPQAIDRATPYDLVFQDVDANGPNAGQNTANVRRDRWCLTPGGVLYQQRQTWTTAAIPAVPSTAACPGSGWTTTTVMADKVTNTSGGQSRPVFTYDATALTDISAVHVDLYVDADPTRKPPETRMTTGVFLRNQNRRPTAVFSAVPSAQGIVLNASASTDPEGQPLSYAWFDGASQVATGVVATYKVVAGTSHTLTVKVTDPAGLTSTAPTQTVVG